MRLDSILHDQSENMAGDLEHRMLGPKPDETHPSNVVVLAEFIAEIEMAGNGRGLL
jgi:hypothetical protein